MSDIYVYFNVNFNVFLNKKVHLLVSELYIYQNARCNDKKYVCQFNISTCSKVSLIYYLFWGAQIARFCIVTRLQTEK
jgi:hypothetical protein